MTDSENQELIAKYIEKVKAENEEEDNGHDHKIDLGTKTKKVTDREAEELE